MGLDFRSNQRSQERAVPFGGYFQREVGDPTNQELMRSGAGSPLGEFMRRFWQPVCLSSQIYDLPLAIKILGEDLVVFRDGENRIGLVHRHCSHRGASLEFGIVEHRGIRCCYHGWLYDIDGTLLETPGEPENVRLKQRICHGAYPAFERDGLVFAYMGPPALKPPFEINEIYDRPGNKMVPLSNFFPCNWLQVQENVPDSIHTAIFHNGIGNAGLRHNASVNSLPAAWASMPVLEFRETEGGRGMVAVATRRVDLNVWVRINHCTLPSNIDIGTLFGDGQTEVYFQRASFNRWVVPHDDESSSVFGWRHFNTFVDSGKGDPEKCGVEGSDFLGGQVGGRPYSEAQRNPGDWETIVSQRTMARHSLEHLGTTDAGVAMWRSLVSKAIQGKNAAVLPKPLAGDAFYTQPQRSYCQDTIISIPPRAGSEEDKKLLQEVGKRVTDIVLSGDELPAGSDRDELIVKRLRALKEEYL
jgi:nitrite reductase/ring-hydroxylating ferredoxin subunit